MRSVVVVLPASMWAMMPMLRMRERSMERLRERDLGKRNYIR